MTDGSTGLAPPQPDKDEKKQPKKKRKKKKRLGKKKERAFTLHAPDVSCLRLRIFDSIKNLKLAPLTPHLCKTTTTTTSGPQPPKDPTLAEMGFGYSEGCRALTLDLVIEQRPSPDQPWPRDFDVEDKEVAGDGTTNASAPKMLLQAIKFNPNKRVGAESFDAAVQFAVAGPPTSVRALRTVSSGE